VVSSLCSVFNLNKLADTGKFNLILHKDIVFFADTGKKTDCIEDLVV